MSPDIGIPHPGLPPDVPDDFAPTDPDSDVGEPGFLGGQEGTPHNMPDTTEPGVFTGTDPKADVGKPNGVA